MLGSEGIDEAASCMKLPLSVPSWEVDSMVEAALLRQEVNAIGEEAVEATVGEGGGSPAPSPLEEAGEPPCCPSALRQEVDAI